MQSAPVNVELHILAVRVFIKSEAFLCEPHRVS